VQNHLKISQFFNEKLCEKGLDNSSAKNVVDALVNASLFGIDSHGVRLFSHYLECLESGRVQNALPVVKKENGLCLCNANHGFAHNAAQVLIQEMATISQDNAVQMGVIINSDHYGASGIHAYNSMVKNRIIISLTNADALANTPDGRSVVFGTNPISCVYQSDEELVYIDLASTVFSMNKVKNYRLSREALPENVARDIHGHITTDPDAAVSLEPIGGHKGFALAFLFELLTSGLTGMSHSKDLLKMYGTDLTQQRGVSHTFIMINPEIFPGGLDSIRNMVQITRDALEEEQLRTSPGVKELETRKQRLAQGIPVDPAILQKWITLGYEG
jgi:ureidoglycolate dehydrogenase (NAD+)